MFPIEEGTGLSHVLGIIFPGSETEGPIEPRKCPNPVCGSFADEHRVIEFGEAGWSNTTYLCLRCKKEFSWTTY